MSGAISPLLSIRFHGVHRHGPYQLFALKITQIFRNQTTSSYYVSNSLCHKNEGIIPVNVQNGINMYQFLLCPRNDVQMFKPTYKSGIFCIKSTNLLAGLFIDSTVGDTEWLS
jgi:hypothetical protein